MTYPPQPGGWQDPAGGNVDPGSQPTYIDPISGQPAAVSPGSVPPGSVSPGAPGQPTYPAYPAYPAYPGAGQTAYPAPQQPYPAYAAPMQGYSYQTAYPGYVVTAERKTNGMSIAALVVSLVALVSLVCYGIGGVVIGTVGAIFGHVARRQIAARSEAGGGMALAGVIIGWISVGLGLVVTALFAWAIWWTVRNNPGYAPTPYST